MRKKLIATIMALTSTSALAETLPNGMVVLRQEANINSADQLYVNDTASQYPGGGGGVNNYLGRTAASFGFANRLQLDAYLAYGKMVIQNLPVQGKPAGYSETYLTDFGARVTKGWVNEAPFSLDTYLGLRSRANTSVDGDSLFAMYDGKTRVDLGVQSSYNFVPGYSAYEDLKYTFRASRYAHIELNLGLRIDLPWSLQFSPFMGWKRSTDGYDLTDPSFTGEFSRVKEEFMGAGFSLSYQVTNSMSADYFAFKKLSGRNTDKNTSMGVAINYIFY
jgi:hypothetical protein